MSKRMNWEKNNRDRKQTEDMNWDLMDEQIVEFVVIMVRIVALGLALFCAAMLASNYGFSSAILGVVGMVAAGFYVALAFMDDP